ncbi:MAG: hypothetical protein AAF728_09375 [Cyanobacteria bacterium P01_D01_bin.128]
MDAFSPVPPVWTEVAKHAYQFCCPACGASSQQAQAVWINRRSPVYTEGHRRKWQEFYQCECGSVWWAWSSDRPPTDFSKGESEV